MPFWLFLPLALAGQVMWMTFTYHLGDALSEWITPFVAFVNEFVTEATLLTVALGSAYVIYRRRTRRDNAMASLAAAGDEAQ